MRDERRGGKGHWQRIGAWALFGALLGATLTSCSQGTHGPYPTQPALQEFAFGDDAVLKVEVADNAATRRRGLMNRPALPPDEGMLFVYPEASIMNFWMRDTFIPLSIAFLDEEGVVTNIELMEPMRDAPGACSTRPVVYAVEANRGWFEQHGIRAGQQIEIPDWVTKLSPEE